MDIHLQEKLKNKNKMKILFSKLNVTNNNLLMYCTCAHFGAMEASVFTCSAT